MSSAHEGPPDDSDPLARLERAERKGGLRVAFRQQLDDCDAELTSIARSVACSVVPVTDAFLQADHHRASDLIGGPLAVERRSVRLEEACYVLLARQAPVAGDLRHLVALLRAVADAQRSANLLRHVADALRWIHPPAMDDTLFEIVHKLGEVSGGIFGDAVTAWEEHDALAANDLAVRDDQVDLLQKELLTVLYTGSQSTEEAVSLALIARYYERVGDHGVEIARHVAYLVTGDRILPGTR